MHLDETFVQNIEVAHKFGCDCEFVLLNYNSTDNLEEWVRGNLGLWMERGMVRYYKTSEPKYFHMSHAKNVAHLLGGKELLCNVDADNFLTRDYLDRLFSVFRKDKDYLTYGNSSAGGRQCIHQDNFYKLNGYDEELIGCARDDRDFRFRAKKLGIKVHKIKQAEANQFIQHSDEIRAAMYDPELTRKMLTQKYEDDFVLTNEDVLKIRHPHVFGSVKYNTWKTKQNLATGKFRANQGGEWGQAKLTDWNGRETYVTHAG